MSGGAARGQYDAPGMLRVARVVQGVLAVLVVAFAVSTLPGVRERPGFSVPVDGWLQGTAYVVCALLALLRPLTVPRFRTLAWVLAAALLARALGFALQLGYVRLQPAPPSPSVADAAWLLSSVLLVVLLGVRLRMFTPRGSRVLVLDAITGALTTAGVAVLLLLPVLESLNPQASSRAAIATNLAYPALDVAIVGAAVGLVVVCRGRPARPDTVLVAGVVMFAVGDSVYLYLLSEGSFRPGTWVQVLSMFATAVMASAMWTRSSRGYRPVPVEVTPTLLVPVVFSSLAVLALVVAELSDTDDSPVPQTAVILLALALLTAIVRAIVSVSSERAEASALLGSATDDVRRFQSLVEASPDFIAMADLQGNLTYMNPAGRRMVGLADGVDVRTTTIPMYLNPEGRRRLVEETRPAVAAQGYWSGESELQHLEGGPPTPVAVNTFRIDDPGSGRPVGLASIQRDVTNRLRNERALRDLADQRQHLLDRLLAAQEDERARIAADVHDDSVQALAAVELRLGLLRRQLGDLDESVLATMDKTHASVVDATARLRQLLFDLESPARDVDLVAALSSAAAHVFEDVETRVEVTGDPDDGLPESIRLTAYRIVKEALVNVRKHAGARQVEVVVTHADGGVEVCVHDDGTGFDTTDDEVTAPRPGHLGLASMHDRAVVAGGRLDVESDASGTVVRLWLPDLSPPVG